MGQMLARRNEEADPHFPSCTMMETEMTDRLCQCRSKIKQGIFEDGIQALEEWIQENDTYAELQEWILVYLCWQGFSHG